MESDINYKGGVRMKYLGKFFFVALVILAMVMHFWQMKPILQAKKSKEALRLQAQTFAALPGWSDADLRRSFTAFKRSCRVFERRNPERNVGTSLIPLTVADWLPACKAAQFIAASDNTQVRDYFEHWFIPSLITKNKPINGLFTGYYSLNLKGSPVKTPQFSVPLYGLPKDLVVMYLQDFDPNLPRKKIIAQVKQHRLKPYSTRKDINAGAIKNVAKPIAWIHSRVDRVFLEIQGSGAITYPDGSKHYFGYAGENGAPYRAIAGVLIEKGVMTPHNASMQGIKAYLKQHPEEIDEVLHKNESFVFFQKQSKPGAMGAQGLALTPKVSLAVDLRYIPLGLPLWLDTKYTDETSKEQDLQQLMLSQDTGGAIRGPVRGDIYWGDTERAAALAGRMKHPGQYWVFVPRLQAKTTP